MARNGAGRRGTRLQRAFHVAEERQADVFAGKMQALGKRSVFRFFCNLKKKRQTAASLRPSTLLATTISTRAMITTRIEPCPDQRP
jgi:hypothetical protein